ncbi:MAG: acetate--CoA ligase family protein [Streptosporangiales bacterium]|nr:acetate--CoA ligase family protein [Streptosporangiales bacterium]
MAEPHELNHEASRALVTPERLRSFFAPRSIATVGASDNSGWGRFIVTSCQVTGFDGPLIPVHPRAETAFGRPVTRNLRDLTEPVDLAFILAPLPAVEGVLDDMGAAGIKNAIVLASGYREVGEEGARIEDSLVARAVANDITLLGPNCLGFLNAHTRAAPYALTLPPPLTAGPVGVVLQSGALASVVLSFARSQAIGLSVLTSVGNESMMKTADVIEYLIEDEATRVIALFLEEIGDPERFAAMAMRADAAGKPVVALKVGSSPAGQEAALAHTGSVAGDDAVVDAALRQLNVIRVTSLEELLSTAALLGYGRHPAGRRMGVLTASGGACDIVADAASAEGIEIPPFAPETSDAITPHIPDFVTAKNPLDVTGYQLANVAGAGGLLPVDYALDAAVSDPGLDFVIYNGLNLPDARPPDEAMAARLERRVAYVAEKARSAPVPVIPIGSTCVNVSDYGRQQLTKNGLFLLPGLDLGVRALGHAVRWTQNRGTARLGFPGGFAGAVGTAPVPTRVAAAGGPWSEAEARDLLAGAGVPVVPGGLATSADEAVALARDAGLPVALKVCSAQITHKSDIGGVALGLATDAEVRAAYAKVTDAGAAVGGAVIDGVLVTPMRSGGVELLAGVTVDPTFGPVLAVGLGGVWVEVLNDTALRVLPADTGEIKAMLGELRGASLLRGARGGPPADLDAVAGAIAGIGHAALSLGGTLRTLEVNPLRVDGHQVEALDVLVVTGEVTALLGADDEPGCQRRTRRTARLGPEVPGRPRAPAASPRAHGDPRRP